MKYTQRLNAFKPTVTWEVRNNGFVWSDDKGGAGEIPWGRIKSVRLRLEPSRAERRRVALHIYTPIDHPITNIHYKGPMNFKAQSVEFKAFVLTFHGKFPKDTNTIFYKGSTRAAYIGNALVTLGLLVFMFLLAPLLALTGIPSISSIVRILIIIIFVPTLLKLLVKNKPATYDPQNIPMDMLD